MTRNKKNPTVSRLKTKAEQLPAVVRAGTVALEFADSLQCYEHWLPPTCIISDGPYGLGKFPGEAHTHDDLAQWYAPHVAAWARAAQPNTTLWFWCSEVGWATVHPVLVLNGWQYEECCVWDKGIAHIAGNCNSKTIRGTPVVTEVAVRYTRRVVLPTASGASLTLKDWVRAEWQRSGLPLSKANEACGVKNAATRKYLTQCHLWYFPPADMLVRMADYCNRHGRATERPYFSIDGHAPVTAEVWDAMRSKWHHTHGITNVWQEPPVHGAERIKGGKGYQHANQKPLALMTRQVLSCTDPGDVVWEPFGGLASGMVATMLQGRRGFAAECYPEFFEAATGRLLGVNQQLNPTANAA